MLRPFASAALAALVLTGFGVNPLAAQSVAMIAPAPLGGDPGDVQLELDGLAFELADLGDQVDAAVSAQLQTNKAVRRPDARPFVIARMDRNPDGVYQNGTRALDNRRWDEAIQLFQRVVELGGARVDGATYWIAWAQNKQGNGAAALDSLTRLRQTYPSSRWVAEARALEVEIRQAAGQPLRPEAVLDDELKLMALNNLVRADEQRAVPMLDKILKGTGSPRLKERALFVLAQNGSTQARQMVTDIAKGAGNPDLQAKAVSYLAVFGGADTKQTMVEIYKSSNSVDVKRNIIRALGPSRDRERLLEIARTEQAPELRAEAVRQLGAMGAQEELFQLYQHDASADVRRRIVQSMFAGNNPDRLIQLLKVETDGGLRRSIIQNLGQMGSAQGTEALLSLYRTEKDDNVRVAIIDAFSNSRNVKLLIDLAKNETNPGLKRRIVEQLSNAKSSEATDYFLEILK
jgi:HEAT repeat protein